MRLDYEPLAGQDVDTSVVSMSGLAPDLRDEGLPGDIHAVALRPGAMQRAAKRARRSSSKRVCTAAPPAASTGVGTRPTAVAATPAGTSAQMSAATRPQRSCTKPPKSRGKPVCTNPPVSTATNTPKQSTRVTRGSCKQHAAAAAAAAGSGTPAMPPTPPATPPMQSTRLTRYSCKQQVGAAAVGAGSAPPAPPPVSHQQGSCKRGLMDEDSRTLRMDVTIGLLPSSCMHVRDAAAAPSAGTSSAAVATNPKALHLMHCEMAGESWRGDRQKNGLMRKITTVLCPESIRLPDGAPSVPTRRTMFVVAEADLKDPVRRAAIARAMLMEAMHEDLWAHVPACAPAHKLRSRLGRTPLSTSAAHNRVWITHDAQKPRPDLWGPVPLPEGRTYASGETSRPGSDERRGGSEDGVPMFPSRHFAAGVAIHPNADGDRKHRSGKSYPRAADS